MSRGDPLKDVSLVSCSPFLSEGGTLDCFLFNFCLLLVLECWRKGCGESMTSCWNSLKPNIFADPAKPSLPCQDSIWLWFACFANNTCLSSRLWFLQIIAYTREEIKKNNISEQTMIGLIWSSVMSSVEWNKKEELVTEQAIKLLKVTPLLLWLCYLKKRTGVTLKLCLKGVSKSRLL